MRMRFATPFTAIVCMVAAGGPLLHGQDTDLSKSIPAFEKLIQDEMTKSGVPGLSVALVDEKGFEWKKGFGLADKASKKPVTEDTLFEVASISKTFTAIMVLQLVEQGKLSLDTPLCELLPEFQMQGLPQVPWKQMQHQPDAARKITLRTMLNHHSSIPGDLMNGAFTIKKPIPDYSAELLKVLSSQYLTRPANESFDYSNTAYSLLEKIIERASGEPFRSYSNRFFQNLGMCSSSFYHGDVNPTQCASGYFMGKFVPLTHANIISAGNVRTSSTDMARYLRVLLSQGNGMLSPETFREMVSPSNGNVVLDGNCKVGLGWFLDEASLAYAGKNFHHSGATFQFLSQMVVASDAGLAAFVSVNDRNNKVNVNRLASQILQEAIRTKTGKSAPTPSKPAAHPEISLPMDELQAIQGKYFFSRTLGLQLGLFCGEIVIREGKPLLCATGITPDGKFTTKELPLTAHAERTFTTKHPVLPDYPLRIQLRPTPSGRPAMLLSESNMMPTLAEKYEPTDIPETLVEAWKKRVGAYVCLNEHENDVNKALRQVMNASPDKQFGIQYQEDRQWLMTSDYNLIAPINAHEAWIVGMGRGQGGRLWFESLPNGEERLHVRDYSYKFDPNSKPSRCLPTILPDLVAPIFDLNALFPVNAIHF